MPLAFDRTSHLNPSVFAFASPDDPRRSRVDARLLTLLDLGDKAILSLLDPEARSTLPPSRLLSGVEWQDGEAYLRVLVSLAPGGMTAKLRDARAWRISETVLAMRIPFRETHALLDDDRVAFVELASPLEGSASVSRKLGLPTPSVLTTWFHRYFAGTGFGTRLLIVDDTGLDWTHPDLRYPWSSNPRVWGLWDQDHQAIAGELGAEPSVDGQPAGGRAWTRDDLRAQLAAPASTLVGHAWEMGSHGTSVAVTAAGCGRESPGWVGPASYARIYFVRTSRPGAWPLVGMPGATDTVAVGLALAWGFAQTGSDRTVAVVTLNHPLGAHDGTSLLETAIDELTAVERRLCVVSAGNTRSASTYRWVQVPGNGAVTVRWYPAAYASMSSGTTTRYYYAEGAQIWFDGSANATLTLTSWVSGSTLTIASTDPTMVLVEGGVQIYVTPAFDGRNGDRVFSIVVEGSHDQVASLNLDLRIQVTGADARVFQVWCAGKGGLDVGSLGCTAAPPATGRRTVVVGAADNATTLRSTSAVGPTRDGRVRPDLCAKGSGFSIHGASDPSGFATQTQSWPALSFTDTSAAAAYVAGVACQLFQALGNVDGSRVKERLLISAVSPGVPVPDAGWGWGYVTSADALAGLVAPDLADVGLKDVAADTGAEPSTAGGGGDSPDVQVRLNGATVTSCVAGTTYDVRVRVRNFGAVVGRNVEVRLDWAWEQNGVLTGWSTAGVQALQTAPALPAGWWEDDAVVAIEEVAGRTEAWIEVLRWTAPVPTAPTANVVLAVRIGTDADPMVGLPAFLTDVQASNSVACKVVTVV